MKNIFKTSMDSYSNDTTVVVTILLIAIFIVQAIFHYGGKIVSIFIPLVFSAIYLRAYFLKPVSYEVTDDFLIIHRIVNDVSIPRHQLNNVDIIDTEKIKYTTKSFGITGLFGYYGKFANKQIGSFTMYATRRNKTVIIQTIDNKQIIVTPDKPARFIRLLNS